MDSSFGQQHPQLDLSKLSDYEKRELQQSLTNEMQKAKIQECMSHEHPNHLQARLLVFLSPTSGGDRYFADFQLTFVSSISRTQPHRRLLEKVHDGKDLGRDFER